ncbi:carboxypeptidase regulatory-like domain-containing protein [soil metagenome]
MSSITKPDLKSHTLCVLLYTVLSLICLSVLPNVLFAQSGLSTLRIIAISEAEGTTVIGATVMLTEPDADTLYAGVTDSYGFVEFSNIPAQTYQVRVSYIGLETHVGLITLEPGLTRIYRPELSSTSAELDEVIVSGEQRSGTVRREAGRQTITGQELRRVPSAGPGGDLTAYLQTLPSVVTTGDRGGELFVRGGTPYQNLVLVENMPIIKPFHISNLFSAFPQEALSSVDIYAGGFGAEYSGASSAVLDVNLRQGSMRRHQGEFAISPYLYSYQLEGPVIMDRHSFFLMGRHSVIEKTGPHLTGEEIPIQFHDLIARYSINWPNLTCNITGINTYDNGQINPVSQVNLSWSNTTAGIRCLGFAEELENAIDFTLGYTGYKSSETGFDNTGRTSSIDMGYMRLDNSQHISDMTLNYGLKLDFIHYTAELDQLFFDGSRREARFVGLGSELDEISTILSVYLSTRWQPGSKLTITPGFTSQAKLRDLSPTAEPRLRISYRPTGSDRQEFSLALGRYFQLHEAITDERDAGTVFGIYKPIDEGDPYPESLHGILGYRQRFNNLIETSIETYIKTHKNIPVAQWTREPGNTLNTGLANGLSYGLDVHLELNMSPLYLSFGYGWSKVTYEAPADELVAWIDREKFRYNPTHDRRHQFNAIASFQKGKFTGNVNWQYSSGGTFTRIFAFDLALQNLPDQDPLENQGTAQTLYSEPFNGRFPGFQRVDISVNRPFELSSLINLKTEIGVINTFNTRNVFYFDINTLQQVNQLPLVPYISVTTRIR